MDLELSLMRSDGAAIRPLLDQFEAEHGIRVRVRTLTWDSAWSVFVRAALYGDGPDVSEVGTTWVCDLVGMNALRPFDAAEVAAMGRASAFLPAAWRTASPNLARRGVLAEQPAVDSLAVEGGAGRPVWSIPWLTGARLVFYRPALLEQAGLDPELPGGDQGLDHRGFLETARRLHEAGVTYPWTAPTGYTHTTLLNIASWVWAAGGDFVSEDGRATRFLEPEALDGLEAYFALGQYMAPDARNLNGLEPDAYFLANPATTALAISGPWVFSAIRGEQGPQRVAVTLPPGASFVGGSNLIVWKNSRNPELAARLVRFLTRHEPQVRYGLSVGLLPARLESLQAEPFTGDPLWRTAARGLMTGRGFPTIRLWGLVEDRLAAGFNAVWREVLAGEPPRAALVRHLSPLAERLDALLARE